MRRIIVEAVFFRDSNMNNRRKLLAREMKHSFHTISALYESRNKRKLICDGRPQAFMIVTDAGKAIKLIKRYGDRFEAPPRAGNA